MKEKDKKTDKYPIGDELDAITAIAQSVISKASITEWVFNITRYFYFVVYLISAAWMSLLVFYVWTEKLIILKIWSMPIIIGMVLMILLMAFDEFKKKPARKLKKEDVFGKDKGVRYIVIDETDPLNGTELILYPFHGCLTGDGKQINFYHDGLIKKVE